MAATERNNTEWRWTAAEAAHRRSRRRRRRRKEKALGMQGTQRNRNRERERERDRETERPTPADNNNKVTSQHSTQPPHAHGACQPKMNDEMWRLRRHTHRGGRFRHCAGGRQPKVEVAGDDPPVTSVSVSRPLRSSRQPLFNKWALSAARCWRWREVLRPGGGAGYAIAVDSSGAVLRHSVVLAAFSARKFSSRKDHQDTRVLRAAHDILPRITALSCAPASDPVITRCVCPSAGPPRARRAATAVYLTACFFRDFSRAAFGHRRRAHTRAPRRPAGTGCVRWWDACTAMALPPQSPPLFPAPCSPTR